MKVFTVILTILLSASGALAEHENLPVWADMKARELKRNIQKACPQLELDAMFANSFLFSTPRQNAQEPQEETQNRGHQ